MATVVVSSGPLGFSSAPASVDLGVVYPGTVAAVTLQGITVTDNRAGTAGWSASVLLTDFTGDATGARLSAAEATYTPTATTTTGTVSLTASPAMDPTTPKIIQTATCVTGNNTATWDASLTLHVPNEAVADAYTATVTYSVS
ncbi:WxL domain-containing protein [Arthrobacter sp. ISL-72]|uniref:WxL domain-containing protein n=1 Tax=Arthrobacter sp. ISL-72 TaxID=2819114 RepID=UPI001BE5433D|nr:WxL domain-containing protein [Arthrobacter sp. ISL-72]MBT2597223.1 WxL domain-containing protein [Arthrobacter sp. ISL-72]